MADGTNTQKKPIIGHCLRCRRALRNTTTDGYGPKCRVMVRKATKAEALNGLKPAQQAKAVELIESGGVVAIRANRIFQVVASNGVDTYKTAVTGQCSCPAGLRGRSTCYHVGAARVLAAA